MKDKILIQLIIIFNIVMVNTASAAIVPLTVSNPIETSIRPPIEKKKVVPKKKRRWFKKKSGRKNIKKQNTARQIFSTIFGIGALILVIALLIFLSAINAGIWDASMLLLILSFYAGIAASFFILLGGIGYLACLVVS